MSKKKESIKRMIKTIYFDEESAQDYLDIKYGGRFDWTTDENKEKISKIICEIDAKAGGKFNIVSLIKASLEGDIGYKRDIELSRIIESTLKNTLLADYLAEADNDPLIKKLENVSIYPPENSFTIYRLFSSYLTVVPKEKLPIDMERLNEAVLRDRGYYEMLVKGDDKTVLRFNMSAFRNNYNLTDLTKMCLVYYGVKVGVCEKANLEIGKEYEFTKTSKVDAQTIFDNEYKPTDDLLTVYDIVLAGVVENE